MSTIFLTVTDLELTASQLVKVIFVLILLFGIGFNLFTAVKADTLKWRIWRIGIALLFMAIAIPIIHLIRVEGSLLSSHSYTPGTTLGYCEAFVKGKGIAFEYEVAGKKYRNCNTFHPISKDSLEVWGGKYLVRYSERFPEEGRIDFHKKVE